MRMRVRVGLAVALLLVLVVACGEEPVAEPPAEPDPAEPTDEPDDEERDVDEAAATRGTLGGDADLEGGCVWLDTDDGRFEVIWPDGWEATADPPTLRDPEGELVAEEGDALLVEGEVDEQVMTICQVGPVLRATAVAPD